MPPPLGALVVVTGLACAVTLMLAIAASIIGRAPAGLTYDGSPVTRVSVVWGFFAFVMTALGLLLWRNPLAWLALVSLFTVELVRTFDPDLGTVRQVAMIVILALGRTRNYYGVGQGRVR